MAAIYNGNYGFGRGFGSGEDFFNNSKKINLDNLRKKLNMEEKNNKILREKIHDLNMARKSDKKKVAKLRKENSELNEKISKCNNKDLNKDKEIEELKQIINNNEKERLKERKNEFSNVKINQIDKMIRKKYIKVLSTQYLTEKKLKKILEKVKEKFELAKKENFLVPSTLNEINDYLINYNSEIKENSNNNLINNNFSNSVHIKKEKIEDDSFELPFVNSPNSVFVQPIEKYYNPRKMNHLVLRKLQNLQKFSNAKINTPNFSLHINRIFSLFNSFQHFAFLYPKVTEYVTNEEKCFESNENINSFNNKIKEINENVIVAEEHWIDIINFFEKADNTPDLLMMIIKERIIEKDTKNYVLFIFDMSSQTVLHYDPTDRTLFKQYRKVYSKFFGKYNKFNLWNGRHTKQNGEITFLYCIEFARRLCLKADSNGINWIKENVMEGRDGGESALEKIDLD